MEFSRDIFLVQYQLAGKTTAPTRQKPAQLAEKRGQLTVFVEFWFGQSKFRYRSQKFERETPIPGFTIYRKKI